MSRNVLEFEQNIADLESKIEELKALGSESDVNISEEIKRLNDKSQAEMEKLYQSLTPWQITQVARHPNRPHTTEYIELMFSDFQELRGDRAFADDRAIIGGLAKFEGQSVMVIGHEKGMTVQDKVKHNFGMPKPEGYRKAMRLMALAEQFGLPILTFIDTPGAFPGVDAEERGQSQAIAESIQRMSTLKVPVIATIIGEGGSGGALAIGVSDQFNMLQYSVYSVISPEGCASILWKTADKAPEAAAAMGITAARLHELKLIDAVLPEPLGGAHRQPETMAATLKAHLLSQLETLKTQSIEQLLATRYERLMSVGRA